MKRWMVLFYGLFCYACFLGVFLYAVGFMGNWLVPRSLDGPVIMPLAWAVPINAALLGLFTLQHSLMARPWFKRWWTNFVPEPMERSTYVLLSSAALALLFWQWQPLGGLMWEIQSQPGQVMMLALFALGWLTVLVTTFLINHFDLFGLRQVWMYFRGQAYRPLHFVTPGPYRWVRHPMYIGWLLAFWATPTMTATHLLFALGVTAYILLAIQWEERDLVRLLGPAYAEYRRRVPMLIPRMPRRSRGGTEIDRAPVVAKSQIR